jgi:protein SCO1
MNPTPAPGHPSPLTWRGDSAESHSTSCSPSLRSGEGVRGWSLLSCLLLLSVALCNKPKDPHAGHAMPAAEDAHPVPTGASLYQFHEKFTDQNGKELMLHELRGKYVVVTMFYATCTAICPRIAAEMLRLEKSFSAAQRGKTRLVMISFDHERDNPAALRKFMAKMRLSDSFTLLGGKPEAIREVAAALGINYKKQDDGEYAHSSVFTLLSPAGEIILQHAGLSVNIETFKEKIGK